MRISMTDTIEVTFFQRRAMRTNYSLERVFDDVRAFLPPGVKARVVIARFKSRGFLGRLYNVFEAPFFQGEVNHITGDVNYLTYLLKKERTLLTIPDFSSLNRLKGWKRRLLFLFWYWLPEKRCKLISVISESTKRELMRYLPHAESKVRVVPCPVSDDFKPSSREFNAERPVLLQVGTGKNKNLIRVIEAIKGIDCHLRIVGPLSSEQLAKLENAEIDFSSVVEISDSQIVQEYLAADMVIFASTYEGFGLPILEAQATGRPVVTSDLMSMPEVAGEAACLVDPYDAQSIRDGIFRVTKDSSYRERLVAEGFRNVTKYHPKAIALQYTDLYREILGR